MVQLEEITAKAVGIAGVLNGIFLGLALADFSMAWYSLVHWGTDVGAAYAFYLSFRHAAPVIQQVLMLLVLLLPFAVYKGIVEDVMGLFSRPDHRRRHVIGAFNLFGMLFMIFWAVAIVLPSEKAAIARLSLEGVQNEDPAETKAAVAPLFWLHLAGVGFNSIMTILPFFKYDAAHEIMKQTVNATPLTTMAAAVDQSGKRGTGKAA